MNSMNKMYIRLLVLIMALYGIADMIGVIKGVTVVYAILPLSIGYFLLNSEVARLIEKTKELDEKILKINDMIEDKL